MNDRIHFMANKMCSQVLDQLINLMQNDPLWEVKVEAINGKLQNGCNERHLCLTYLNCTMLLKGIVHLKCKRLCHYLPLKNSRTIKTFIKHKGKTLILQKESR